MLRCERIPRSSGSVEPVIVVQATKNGRRDDALSERNVVTVKSRFDGEIAGLVGDIWAERRMRSRSIVVGHPREKNAPEMRLRERDEEVQALPARGANQSLTIGICSWRSWRRSQDLNTHRSYRLP